MNEAYRQFIDIVLRGAVTLLRYKDEYSSVFRASEFFRFFDMTRLNTESSSKQLSWLMRVRYLMANANRKGSREATHLWSLTGALVVPSGNVGNKKKVGTKSLTSEWP